MADYFDDGRYAGDLGGSVYVKNENKPFADTGAIYDKGAWVLHMLKHVMGEEEFFTACRNYREAFSFSNASTLRRSSSVRKRWGKCVWMRSCS